MESRSIFEATELSLAPPGTSSFHHKQPNNKRPLASEENSKDNHDKDAHESTPAPKAQVVGWPPVRSSFKRNVAFNQPKKTEQLQKEGLAPLFVKVSMDGAPYLRKIDLNSYKGYDELRHALDLMFKCFSLGSECVIAYEDKDGDWMLAGDVPWMMFTSSCKRLRIMKGTDARGLGTSQ